MEYIWMKCAVHKCENDSYEGNFIGNLCKSCHKYLTAELERPKDTSQVYRNRLEETKRLLMEAELFQVREKWEKDHMKF
jgi:hypothetical protein